MIAQRERRALAICAAAAAAAKTYQADRRGHIVVRAAVRRLRQVRAEGHLARRHVLVARHLGRDESVALVGQAHELIAVVGIVSLPQAGELVLREEAAEDEEAVAAERRLPVSLALYVPREVVAQLRRHHRRVLLPELGEVVPKLRREDVVLAGDRARKLLLDLDPLAAHLREHPLRRELRNRTLETVICCGVQKDCRRPRRALPPPEIPGGRVRLKGDDGGEQRERDEQERRADHSVCCWTVTR